MLRQLLIRGDDLNSLAERLRHLVYNGSQKPIVSTYADVVSLVKDDLHIELSELPSGARAEARIQFGYDNLLRPCNIALLVNNRSANKDFAVLHELGHIAHQSRFFELISRGYHRMCLRPEHEFTYGAYFNYEGGNSLRVFHEMQADLFAWAAIAGDPVHCNSTVQPNVNFINTAKSYPYLGQMIDRIEWCEEALSIRTWIDEYVADAYSTLVSRVGAAEGAIWPTETIPPFKRSNSCEFLRRVPATAVEDWMAEEPTWVPVLCPVQQRKAPDFHIPLMTQSDASSQPQWRHILWESWRASHPLEHWVRMATESNAWLMLFANSTSTRRFASHRRNKHED